MSGAAADGLVSLAAEARWAREWLFESALPRWWPAGRAPNGFYDALDLGQPAGGDLRARVQARQLYVYAQAGALGWSGPWREAVAHGARFLLQHADGSHGLMPPNFGPDGEPRGGDFDLYDQAFALFGHSAAFEATGGAEHVDAAAGLLQRLKVWQLRPGVFVGPRDDGTVRANPHMHLLEAALAWARQDVSSEWGALARNIAEVAHDRFIDQETGRLGEYFDLDLRPSGGPARALVEPGHQFEWAWLFHLADRAGVFVWPEIARDMAHRAAETGVDRRRGVAVNAQDAFGRWTDADARLWPQCERLRAALAIAERTAGPESVRWRAEALAAVVSVRSFLDRPEPGLWRDIMRADGSFDDGPTKASSLYHVVGALSELIQHVDRFFAP